MKDAAEYLAQVKALIVMNPQVVHWAAAREEAQGDAGLFRYKLPQHTIRVWLSQNVLDFAMRESGEN